ncbi:PTS sugar transporter subunit IIC [Enterococcus saccharolyticus]|uniref:Permease IIC component n=1 Tax=Candidatus Enterococcus willemsii TaxID=1857215 RepID=A0ABQ6Z0Y6_9ENTE|nr:MULTISPECIES: PTS transporter subunit EIIC [Enterococcus]KAF1304620.1 PTS sugar transporter [Enterococcus sp. CU12B]MCD5001355.1 PTS sugar transporter subunit IIC [Enterococcus saccharolyticus]
MSFSDKIANLIMPFASKMANQRHLVAIRDSFIDIMPIIMANSLFILLNALIFSNPTIQQFIDLSALSELALMVNNGTMGLMTVFVTFLIGYRLSSAYIANGTIERKNLSELHVGILSLALTMIMFPLFNEVTPVGATESVEVAGVYLQSLTSSGGMFVGIIAALLGTELLVRISNNEKLRIKMPDGVPPAVAGSFNSLIPECLVIIIFAGVTFAIVKLTGQTIPAIIQTIISTPLQYAMESPIGLFVVQIFTQVFWFFGLHGQNIVSSVTSPPMLTAIQQNIDAFNMGEAIPNIVTNPWIGMYTLFGGTGAILPLLIAIFLVSKRKDYKDIAKISLFPSVFNISEPVMFGLPVVMNPFLLIPFICVPLINLAIAYPLTAIGLVAKSVVIPPWILPPVISAWVTTAGDIPATLLSLALFVLDIFLYMPFVLASNKALRNNEMN